MLECGSPISNLLVLHSGTCILARGLLPIWRIQVHLSLNISTNLHSLFTWNTKQVFVFLTAEFETPKNYLSQVLISAPYFGDYDVLYITYPGLPPSPPGAPENYDTASGAFGNGNIGKHPLAVDPTKNKGKLSGSLIAIIVFSSIIALVLSIGVVWLLWLKCRARSSLPTSSSQSLPPPFTMSSATGPVISRPS